MDCYHASHMIIFFLLLHDPSEPLAGGGDDREDQEVAMSREPIEQARLYTKRITRP